MLRPRRMLVEEADAPCWTAQHSTTSRGFRARVHLPRRRAVVGPAAGQATPPRRRQTQRQKGPKRATSHMGREEGTPA